MRESLAICENCRHYNKPAQPELYTATELQTAGALKSLHDSHSEQKQDRSMEDTAFRSGDPFTWEPINYEWCEILTPVDLELQEKMQIKLAQTDREGARMLAETSHSRMQRLMKEATNCKDPVVQRQALKELERRLGRLALNPVTGELINVFALCRRVNAERDCVLFEPSSPSEGE